jgi:hypothetical protein
MSKISLFCEKDNIFEPDLEKNSLNEPTIFIKITYNLENIGDDAINS